MHFKKLFKEMFLTNRCCKDVAKIATDLYSFMVASFWNFWRIWDIREASEDVPNTVLCQV